MVQATRMQSRNIAVLLLAVALTLFGLWVGLRQPDAAPDLVPHRATVGEESQRASPLESESAHDSAESGGTTAKVLSKEDVSARDAANKQLPLATILDIEVREPSGSLIRNVELLIEVGQQPGVLQRRRERLPDGKGSFAVERATGRARIVASAEGWASTEVEVRGLAVDGGRIVPSTQPLTKHVAIVLLAADSQVPLVWGSIRTDGVASIPSGLEIRLSRVPDLSDGLRDDRGVPPISAMLDLVRSEYRIIGERKGLISIFADSQEALPWSQLHDLDGVAVPLRVDLDLSTGAILELRVRDFLAEGAPAALLPVELSFAEEHYRLPEIRLAGRSLRYGQTDENGIVVFSGLPRERELLIRHGKGRSESKLIDTITLAASDPKRSQKDVWIHRPAPPSAVFFGPVPTTLANASGELLVCARAVATAGKLTNTQQVRSGAWRVAAQAGPEVEIWLQQPSGQRVTEVLRRSTPPGEHGPVALLPLEARAIELQWTGIPMGSSLDVASRDAVTGFGSTVKTTVDAPSEVVTLDLIARVSATIKDPEGNKFVYRWERERVRERIELLFGQAEPKSVSLTLNAQAPPGECLVSLVPLDTSHPLVLINLKMVDGKCRVSMPSGTGSLFYRVFHSSFPGVVCGVVSPGPDWGLEWNGTKDSLHGLAAGGRGIQVTRCGSYDVRHLPEQMTGLRAELYSPIHGKTGDSGLWIDRQKCTFSLVQ